MNNVHSDDDTDVAPHPLPIFSSDHRDSISNSLHFSFSTHAHTAQSSLKCFHLRRKEADGWTGNFIFLLSYPSSCSQ